MAARRTAWPLLWAALGCLPSDDLSRYSAAWSEAASGSDGAPEDGVESGVAAAEPGSLPGGASGAGPSSGSAGAVATDGVVGGGTLPLAGASAGGLEPGSADAGTGAGGASREDEPAPPEACLDGLLGADGSSCYRVSLVVASWQAAQADCAAWQGALVEIETPEEDAFIDGVVAESVWIGGSDTVFENVFVWTDGSPILFGNWGVNQPDRFPGPDCVEKRGALFGRQWFDQPCSNERAFVCEKAVAAPP